MPAPYNANKVISGNYGEIWVDGDYYAEVTSGKATVKVDYQDIQMVGQYAKGQKITGRSGEGEITGNKLRSFWIAKLSEELKAGRVPEVNITMKLSDPNAYGWERVNLYNCTFEELPLMDFKGGEIVEETVSFKFEDYAFDGIIGDIEFESLLG